MKPVKKAALLHSMCSVGKASLTNMIPVLSTMGIEACPIPTAILSTHTGGYGMPAKQEISKEYIKECADHFKENKVTFDLIFIGYLGNPEMVFAIQYFVEQFPEATVFLDPIMGDHGTFYKGLGEEYAHAFQTLFPFVDVIVPNMTEAFVLTKRKYHEKCSKSEYIQICKTIHDFGIKTVILTSVLDEEKNSGIVLSESQNPDMIVAKREPIEFHGSGDLFDAVLIGTYLQNKSWHEAVVNAHHFVSACIQNSASFEYKKREGLMIENNLYLLV